MAVGNCRHLQATERHVMWPSHTPTRGAPSSGNHAPMLYPTHAPALTPAHWMQADHNPVRLLGLALEREQRQRLADGRSLREAIDGKIAAVLNHGQYILGPEGETGAAVRAREEENKSNNKSDGGKSLQNK